ncbi:MAG: MATE family efflux transporter [Holdemanella sp.]|nr:MATE family efflux transporter [Holdemanella sp.]
MENIFDLNNIKKTYLKLAFPVVLGMVVGLVYNLTDTFFIAKTNDMALVAGISLCGPLFTALMAFGNIYAQGGSSLISRLLGEKDENGSRRVSSFCFYIAILTGIIIGLILIVFSNPILTLIGATKETYKHAYDYYMVLAIGSPIVVLNFIHMNLVRCEGKATLSMIGNVVGTLINIVLDPVFIFGLNMGAKGAAIATIIGYSFSCIFLGIYVYSKSKVLSIKPSECKVSADEVKQIFLIGISAAITNIATSICVIITNKLLLAYGTNYVASMGIVSRVNMIGQMAIIGFAFGGVPLFGFVYGSKNYQKLKELISFVCIFLVSLSAILSGIIFLSSNLLVKIFVSDIEVISIGSTMLKFQVAGNCFMAIVLLFTVLFQATGKAIPSFCCSLSRQGVVYVIVIFVLNKIMGYNGILISQLVADIISAIMAYCLYTITFKNEFNEASA